MGSRELLLFKTYPKLKEKVPWIPLLTNVPTPIERLTGLERKFDLVDGQIFLKRDDKNHDVYGGNKLRKFEFIFGDVIKKKKKGVVSYGGIGTNHGLACAIVCKKLSPSLKCHLFLYNQPLTWHVQRSLLLYDYFGSKLHYGKTDVSTFIKTWFFQINHPKYYFILPGGSPLFGRGTPLGIIGFINAILELHEQIKNGVMPEPDVIFIAGSTTGTAAGLIAGCKLLGLKSIVYPVVVYKDFLANSSNVARNANKALKYLRKKDNSFPKIEVTEKDFEFIKGYLGSGYGVKTIKSQNAVDTVYKLEGQEKGFHLETTYTGKAMAAMFDFLKKEENKSKIVLFWNTYNSNDLDLYVKETDFNYQKLPTKFHKFFNNDNFQCWQITECPTEIREECKAYLNQEYRFWKITNCSLDKTKSKKAFETLSKLINLEEA